MLIGVTEMDVNVGAVTLRVAELLPTPSWEAVMLVVPAETAVARPDETMLATVGMELTQVALLVRSAVLLSLNVPVAVNCWVSPS